MHTIKSLPVAPFALFIAVLLALLPVTGQAGMRLVSKEIGLFDRANIANVVLESGERILPGGRSEIIKPLNQFPAELGTKFGVRFKLSGKKRGQQNVVTMLYLSPGLIDDKGVHHDKYVVTKDLSYSSANHVMAFEITDSYEQKPGIWEFMVFEEDRLLLRETFELLPPKDGFSAPKKSVLEGLAPAYQSTLENLTPDKESPLLDLTPVEEPTN